MVKIISTIKRIVNNLKVDIPKFLQNISLLPAFVSLTKYQTKTARKSLVTIAGINSGLKNPIIALITKDQITKGL